MAVPKTRLTLVDNRPYCKCILLYNKFISYLMFLRFWKIFHNLGKKTNKKLDVVFIQFKNIYYKISNFF